MRFQTAHASPSRHITGLSERAHAGELHKYQPRGIGALGLRVLGLSHACDCGQVRIRWHRRTGIDLLRGLRARRPRPRGVPGPDAPSAALSWIGAERIAISDVPSAEAVADHADDLLGRVRADDAGVPARHGLAGGGREGHKWLIPGWADRGVRRHASLRRSGQARLTQRPGGGCSSVHWADWLDPGLYMTHNPRHGR